MNIFPIFILLLTEGRAGEYVSNFYTALNGRTSGWGLGNFYLTEALSSPQPLWCGLSVSKARATGQAVSLVLSTRRSGSIPRQSMWHLWWTKGPQGEVWLRVLRFLLSLPFHQELLHNLHLDIPLTGKKNGKSLGTFQKRNALSTIGKQWSENCFHFFQRKI